MYVATLVCHPRARSGAVTAVTASVDWLADGRLELTYNIKGDCNELRVPPLGPVKRTDGLWQHTCCEAFLACAGVPAYREYNFSPSREWAVYAFRGYRDRIGEAPEGFSPAIVTTYSENALVLTARVRLPETMSFSALQLGLSTVLEGRNSGLSYWALRHPPGQPDFHNRDAFVLLIDPRPGDGSRGIGR